MPRKGAATGVKSSKSRRTYCVMPDIHDTTFTLPDDDPVVALSVSPGKENMGEVTNDMAPEHLATGQVDDISKAISGKDEKQMEVDKTMKLQSNGDQKQVGLDRDSEDLDDAFSDDINKKLLTKIKVGAIGVEVESAEVKTKHNKRGYTGSKNVKKIKEEAKPEVKKAKAELKEVKPEVKEVKPEVKEAKPEVIEAKPEVKEAKPEVKEAKPEVKEAKPEVKEANPEVKEANPEVKEANPEVKVAKPEIKEAKPEIKEAKAEVKEAKPEVKAAKPEVKEAKPEAAGKGPALRTSRRPVRAQKVKKSSNLQNGNDEEAEVSQMNEDTEGPLKKGGNDPNKKTTKSKETRRGKAGKLNEGNSEGKLKEDQKTDKEVKPRSRRGKVNKNESSENDKVSRNDCDDAERKDLSETKSVNKKPAKRNVCFNENPVSEETSMKPLNKRKGKAPLESTTKDPDVDDKEIPKKRPRGVKKPTINMELKAKMLKITGARGNKYIGAHVSMAGGLWNAVDEAVHLGARAFGMFLKNQRRWQSKPLEDEEANTFITVMKEYGFSPSMVVPHGSYLMNCGSSNTEILDKSRAMLIDELQRCDKLGLPIFNFHPGSTCGKITVSDSIQRIAESIDMALEQSTAVIAVLENMCCQGDTIGGRFSELAEIIERVEDKSRIGVCLDTCHAFAAGYDMRSEEDYEKTMEEFDRVIGFNYLKAVHLNDSKGELGCHLDRHENIDKGDLSLKAFRFIMNDPRFDNIPMILETPNTDYSKEIKLLNELIE